MKKKNLPLLILMVMCISAISFACTKPANDSKDQLYENSPATGIPDQLKFGYWFWGGIGPVSYYDRDGHEVGNGTEAAREYFFSEVAGKGRLEFTQYLGMRNASNCVTEIYTHKKGSVVFEGTDKLIFYPLEGNFKTIKKGCSADGTTDRKATADDLKPETMLWEIKTVSGEPLLYIYDAQDAAKQNPVFVYSYSK